MSETKNLNKQFAIGVPAGGDFIRDYTLLRSNGMAERVFMDKIPDKPYTWMANVISIATGFIGSTPVAGDVRKEYSKTESVYIPDIVKQIPISEANTMIVEIHRTVWKNLVRKQESMCRYCGNTFFTDVDLNNLKFNDDQKNAIASRNDWNELVAELPVGYTFEGFEIMGADRDLFNEYKGFNFDRFTFRIPTLGDAIANERYYTDVLMLWRRIAFDCLTKIGSSQVTGELPIKAKAILGLKLFNEELDSEDLEVIRTLVRDAVPTIELFYNVQCPTTQCRKETPITIEANSFFSA